MQTKTNEARGLGNNAAFPANAMLEGQSSGTAWLNDCGNLAQLLLRQAVHAPRAGAMFFSGAAIDDSTLCSYPELAMEARCILGGLRGAGLQPGHKVALLLQRPQDFLPAFWACILGGFVPCPLTMPRGDAAQKVAQLSNLSRLLEGPCLVTTRELQPELPPVDGVSVVALETLRESQADSTTHQARREDLALLVLTSGSTGNSKAVMLTHGNLLASMAAKMECQKLTPEDVTLNWISFDHVAGLLECHMLPLVAGAIQLHVESQFILDAPLRFLELISQYRVTMTFTPNFLLGHINKELAQAPEQMSLDLSSLKHIVSGGESNVCKTAEAFLDQLARFGLSRGALWPAFGMTETCAGSVYSREFPGCDGGLEFASLGLPVQGMQLRIVDAELEAPVPDGTAGELQVRGPMIFRGYFNNPTATRDAFTPDGWFRTGDRGVLKDGRLSLVGRSKDSIIINGVNYYSHELEAVLEEIEGVEKSYVAAFPIRPKGADTEQLAVLFATSVPKEDEAELHRLLISVRNRVILLWGFRPAVVLPLPKSAFPKTSLGKIPRAQLRKRLEGGEFAPDQTWIAEMTSRQLGGYVAPQGEYETALCQIYAGLFGLEEKTLSATANFFEIGGTSLDVLRLKARVEQRFGVTQLPILWLMQHPTVRELASRLEQRERPKAGTYDPIVPLQLGGTKTPLFCVHPGVGEVLVFVNLAKYFTNERPFYALRARGFNEGETYFTSFPEMVDCYARAIRAKQPKGPYALAGYSYGGAVAFEIAKVLEAQGERVDFVGIFNLPPHIKYRMNELNYTEGMLNLAFFLDLIKKSQTEELSNLLQPLSKQEQLDYIMKISPKKRLEELDLDVNKFGAWAELTQSLLKMGREYEPSGSVRSLSVFYAIPLAGTKQDWLNKQLKQWDRFAREPNRYIDVPGEHYTLMGAKHVSSFQAILRKELERAEARSKA
ncbi:AMP-binding protein [Hyalangium versicolor]|uniref:AMP-binding protein n=1 Tax=Hyalangium versicolor TaxID=2861190 RepID=UPI001CCEC768|nr:non-ribosomal peptide synthetase [Hyalangium versicolor]